MAPGIADGLLPAPPGECLSEEMIAAFAQGALASATAETVDAHIAVCQACFLVVTEAVKGYSGTSRPFGLDISGSPRVRTRGAAAEAIPAFEEVSGADAGPVGRYAVFGPIASGGMATVHFGRLVGAAGFARTVAIKKLHAHFARDPAFVAMFVDEARLAARIRHPNVVPTLDVIAHGGELFLVMDYVPGETLARLEHLAASAGEAIPPPVACAIVAGVLEGLHAAHEATDERGGPLGIVHRDVSPQNILVGTDGVARVLDFGVAKAAGRMRPTTREGTVKGKLPYMPPEQIRGSVTRATDVYAASVVLWEALAGARLFRGSNDAELLERVLHARIEPPSRRAAGLSAALDAVVLRGLERDPAKRFATARDMARALERAVPAAATSDVGEWVARLARATLRARAEEVARIEGDQTTIWTPAIEAALGSSPPGSSPPGSSSPPSPSPAPLAPMAPNRHRRAGAALGLTLAAASLLAWGVATKRTAGVPAAPASTSNAGAAVAPAVAPDPHLDPDERASASPATAPSASPAIAASAPAPPTLSPLTASAWTASSPLVDPGAGHPRRPPPAPAPAAQARSVSTGSPYSALIDSRK